MADLHVRRGDTVLGPFPPDKIKQMIADGKIRQNDLIRVEGDDQWMSLRDIPNLAKLFGPDNPQTTKRQTSPGPDSASSDPQKMFVKRGEAVRGPLTLKAVLDGIAAGKIDRADQIGPRNTGPWKEAGSLSKFFSTDEVVSDEFDGFDFDENEPDDPTYGLARSEISALERPVLLFDDDEASVPDPGVSSLPINTNSLMHDRCPYCGAPLHIGYSTCHSCNRSGILWVHSTTTYNYTDANHDTIKGGGQNGPCLVGQENTAIRMLNQSVQNTNDTIGAMNRGAAVALGILLLVLLVFLVFAAFFLGR